MATTYTSTIQLACRKEHTCANCGATFSYPFKRKVTGSSGNAAKAKELAQRNVARVLERDVDPHPCPTCGLYQPDMIGQGRAKRHKLVVWLAAIALIVLLFVRLAKGMQANTATWAIVLVAAVAAMIHAMTEVTNPNANPDANRQLGTDQISSGALSQTLPGRTGTPGDEHLNPPRSLVHKLALPLLAAAVILAALPEALRASRHWPLNAAAYPPVVPPATTPACTWATPSAA